MNEQLDICKYDKIICSKDIKDKLSTIFSTTSQNHILFHLGFTVHVNRFLPDNTCFFVDSNEIMPRFIPVKFNIREYRIGEIFDNCKNKLQELKEKLFNQLEELLK